jgi:hypothetical protein
MTMKGMIQPESQVLPGAALVPDRNVIDPPPDRFTHTVTRVQPYFYAVPSENHAPDGHFQAGALVVLLKDQNPYCWVADAQGLYVATERDGLAQGI